MWSTLRFYVVLLKLRHAECVNENDTRHAINYCIPASLADGLFIHMAADKGVGCSTNLWSF